MDLIIDSFKRLFDHKEIDIVKVKAMLSNKQITTDEYNYIIGKSQKGKTNG